MFYILWSQSAFKTATFTKNVAMLIVKKRTQALQEYRSVNLGKAQTRLLFVV